MLRILTFAKMVLARIYWELTDASVIMAIKWTQLESFAMTLMNAKLTICYVVEDNVKTLREASRYDRI